MFQSCISFVSGDLSSLYLDAAKDRLYIQAGDSTSRRACQTVQAAVLQVGGGQGGEGQGVEGLVRREGCKLDTCDSDNLLAHSTQASIYINTEPIQS